MPSIDAAADLLVLPSDRQETWGFVVNEAMACGISAVVSDAVGCGPDLIEAGGTGAVFPFGDIAAPAQAIRSTPGLVTIMPSPSFRHEDDGLFPSGCGARYLGGEWRPVRAKRN